MRVGLLGAVVVAVVTLAGGAAAAGTGSADAARHVRSGAGRVTARQMPGTPVASTSRPGPPSTATTVRRSAAKDPGERPGWMRRLVADVRVTRPPAIVGFVTDQGGHVIPDITVTARGLDGATGADAVSDHRGRVALRVPAGGYRLTATLPSGATLSGADYTGPAADADGVVHVPAGSSVALGAFATPFSPGVSGRVTDQTGQPLVGFTVRLSGYEGINLVTPTVRTDSEGRYRIGPLEPGTYTVCALGTTTGPAAAPDGYAGLCDDGWAGDPDPPTVTAAAPAAGVDFALPTAGALSGVVASVVAGPQVRRVLLYGATGHAYLETSSSAVDGSYRFSGLRPASDYQVCFVADARSESGCYLDQPYANAIAGDPVTVAPGLTTSGVDGHVAAPGGITGRVVDPQGVPLAGVGVSGPDGATTTRADGTYELDGVAPGPATVCFAGLATPTGHAATGYLAQCYDDGPAGGSPGGTRGPAQVTDGTVTTGIDATLAPASTVSGTVTDDAGTPLAGVLVTVGLAGSASTNPDRHVARTASDGTYRVPDVQPGRNGVCFTADARTTGSDPLGYVSTCPQAYDTLQVGPGTDVTAVDQSLLRHAGVSGYVTGADGTPLAGLTVTGGNGGAGVTRSTVTDAHGAYVIDDLVVGATGVCVDTGYADLISFATGDPGTYPYLSECTGPAGSRPAGTSPDVTLTAGTTTAGVSLVLQRSGTIALTLTDTAGHPLSGQVTVSAAAGPGVGDGLDPDGAVSFPLAAPGRYAVCWDRDLTGPGGERVPAGCYADPDQPHEQYPVQVAAAATTRQTIRLAPAG